MSFVPTVSVRTFSYKTSRFQIDENAMRFAAPLASGRCWISDSVCVNPAERRVSSLTMAGGRPAARGSHNSLGISPLPLHRSKTNHRQPSSKPANQLTHSKYNVGVMSLVVVLGGCLVSHNTVNIPRQPPHQTIH